jgi:galactokinase
VVGKHTDYAKGQSVVCAIDRGIALVYQPSAAARLRVASEGAPILEFDLSDRARLSASVTRSAEGAHWGKYVASVVNYLGLHLGLALPALDVGVGSSLPQNAGLSSSSAVVCGLAALLSRSMRELTVDELGRIESNNLVGTRGGSQDHAAIMGSRQGLLSLWDYREGTRLVRQIALPEELCFVVAVSGVSACKTGNALERYNALATASAAVKEERAREETSEAVQLFCQGVSVAIVELRSAIEARKTDQGAPCLPSFCLTFLACAGAQVEENDRVKMAQAIALSQRHAEATLGTCVAQTEFLPRTALKLGAIGSTTFGAGFGGSVYALVPAADARSFVQRWREEYTRSFPVEADAAAFFLTRPSMGATFVSL